MAWSAGLAVRWLLVVAVGVASLEGGGWTPGSCGAAQMGRRGSESGASAAKATSASA